MDKLEKEINEMKDNLITIAKEDGLTSNDTVWYSQMLDKLIIKYQRLMHGGYGDDSQASPEPEELV